MTTTPTELTTPQPQELTEDVLQDVVGGGTIANAFEGRRFKPKGYIGETEKNLRNQLDREAQSLMEEEGIFW